MSSSEIDFSVIGEINLFFLSAFEFKKNAV
jgi:hypothetical protein